MTELQSVKECKWSFLIYRYLSYNNFFLNICLKDVDKNVLAIIYGTREMDLCTPGEMGNEFHMTDYGHRLFLILILIIIDFKFSGLFTIKK